MAKGISHEKRRTRYRTNCTKTANGARFRIYAWGKNAGNAFFRQKFAKTVDNCVCLMLY